MGTALAEVLPRQRYKYPASLRLTYYATDLVQLRGFYRFYNDNFGIRAHTFELETPLKVTPFFTRYPCCRYHTQTAADYFAPYLQRSVSDEYYTSDYDLAAFSATKIGFGFRYAPLYGLGRFKTPFGGRVARFYGYYRQNTGLTANVVRAYPNRLKEVVFLGHGYDARISHFGHALGTALAQAACPCPEGAPVGLPQTARARPAGARRYFLCAAHGLPVESAERDGHLLGLHGPRPVPGVGAGRRLRPALGRSPARL